MITWTKIKQERYFAGKQAKTGRGVGHGSMGELHGGAWIHGVRGVYVNLSLRILSVLAQPAWIQYEFKMTK